MKKNDWILATAVATYSFLFYEQTAGINFLLFNSVVIALLLIKNATLISNKNWILAALGSLLSALCIGIYDSSLAIIANVVSLGLLSSMSYNSRSSVLFSLLYAAYSILSSPAYIVIDAIERKQKNNTIATNVLIRKVTLIAVPILVTLVFFFMYKAANPLFNDLANKINIDFISFYWLAFTLGGLLLMYGFFHQQTVKDMNDFEANSPNTLPTNTISTITLFEKPLAITDEIFSGQVLFTLLNGLLLIVNILDINFHFMGGKLPKGLTYSEFVHQGTGTLIMSIVFAIAIILFYFRGELNFNTKNKDIKYLAYAWIIQNVFMLLSTAFKNNLYVTEYGLTYKRIGVYIYLILCVLGLITTFIKIMKAKSNIYLFRTNGWLFYGVLVLSCVINWDSTICTYNMNAGKEQEYLLELSDTNLPEIFTCIKDTTTTMNQTDYNSRKTIASKMGNRLYNFMSAKNKMTWKSWYYNNDNIYKRLMLLNQQITTLTLQGEEVTNLAPLKEFTNVQQLTLNDVMPSALNDLHYFSKLKSLTVSQFDYYNDDYLIYKYNLSAISKLTQLQYLDINDIEVNNYVALYNLTQLKELLVSNTISYLDLKILHKKLPTTKIVVEGGVEPAHN
ncbi:MAG: DUF4173 domain-containing protein [Bacteroidia bacterium]